MKEDHSSIYLAQSLKIITQSIRKYVVRKFQENEKYERLEKLGEGLTAEVFKVASKKNMEKVYALKIIAKAKLAANQLP